MSAAFPNQEHWPWISLLFFSLLILIGQFGVWWHINHRVETLIEEKVGDLLVIETDKIDSALLDEKSLVAEQLNWKFEKLQEEISRTENRLKNEYFFFITIGIPLTLIGILGVLYSAYDYMKKQAKEKVEEAIQPIVKQNEKSILDLLKKYDRESILFNNKIVRVWGENYDTIKTVLDNVGFNTDNLISYGEMKEGKAYHILLINNESGNKLPKKPGEKEEDYQGKLKKYNDKLEQIKDLISKQEQTVCIFYYCSEGVNFPIWEIKDKQLQARINFATNPSQIYGNLLNSLKYQDHIEKS